MLRGRRRSSSMRRRAPSWERRFAGVTALAAREHLRQALELATICGAAALAARAETELLATGARPRRIALSGVELLTAQRSAASPRWRPKGPPTARSRKRCSSPRGPSRSTSRAFSASSRSTRARNSPPPSPNRVAPSLLPFSRLPVFSRSATETLRNGLGGAHDASAAVPRAPSDPCSCIRPFISRIGGGKC